MTNSTTPSEITKRIKAELSSACNLIGKQIPFWTQGGGGNVSVKQLESTVPVLFIKASGFRLDQVTEKEGIAALHLPQFIQGFPAIDREESGQKELVYSALIHQETIKEAAAMRPSMESGFHALLPGRFVAHFHSLVAMWVAERIFRGEKDWLAKIGNNVICLPPSMPGYELSKAITAHPDHKIFVLKNHGVVIQGDGIDVLTHWQNFENNYVAEFGLDKVFSWLRDGKIDWGLLPSGQFRALFPDFVIFSERIKKLLIQDDDSNCNGLYKLMQNAEMVDKDAAEVWAATVALQHHDPRMSELPEAISGDILKLPVEQVRVALMKNDKGTLS